MVTEQTPDWVKQIQEAAAVLGTALEKISYVALAQAAMGWLFQGNLDAAQRELEKLPADQLQAVSVAASALASLADDVAATKHRP